MNDKLAQRWDSIYQGTPLNELPWDEGKPSALLVELIESGIVEKGDALDVCCGSGNNALYLAQQGFHCFGIDISPIAIGYARERVAAEGDKCELTTGNVLKLPYHDNTFSLVFDRGCFHSMQPVERLSYANAIYRVLKPRGKYLLLCFSSKDHNYGPPYGFAPKDIKRYFGEFFRIRRIKEFTAGGQSSKSYFLSVLMEKPAYWKKGQIPIFLSEAVFV